MKKILISLFITLTLASSFSNASITSFDERFTILCEIEQSTGFDWSNGDWHRAHFKAGQKYIIKKQNDEKSIDDGDYARSEVAHIQCTFGREKESENYSWVYRDGCYLIKEFGKEATASSYNNCRESWQKDEQGFLKLDSISCPSFWLGKMAFKPNGLIHLIKGGSLESSPEAYIEDGVTIFPADYKDSMSMSVGKCSTI